MEININTKCLVLGDLPSSEMPKRFNAYPYLVDVLKRIMAAEDTIAKALEDTIGEALDGVNDDAYDALIDARELLETLNA